MQVIIKVDTSEVDKELSDLAKRLQNKTAILHAVAEEIQESVKDACLALCLNKDVWDTKRMPTPSSRNI